MIDNLNEKGIKNEDVTILITRKQFLNICNNCLIDLENKNKTFIGVKVEFFKED